MMTMTQISFLFTVLTLLGFFDIEIEFDSEEDEWCINGYSREWVDKVMEWLDARL